MRCVVVQVGRSGGVNAEIGMRGTCVQACEDATRRTVSVYGLRRHETRELALAVEGDDCVTAADVLLVCVGGVRRR